MSRNRPALALVGAAYLTDLYPNVKYKVAMLQEAANPVMQLYDLGEGSLAKESMRRGPLARIGFIARFLWAQLWVFTRALLRPAATAYLPYPAVPTLLFYSLWPRRQRPRLVADAFISLYDTIVLDRGLLDQRHWLARLLFNLEKRAYNTADVVLVDTLENGAYYAELFNLPRARFVELPLSLPPLQALPTKSSGDSSLETPPAATFEKARFRCLFMGSMVPLQGIETILEAARLLESSQNIEFMIIGTGQQAGLVERFITANSGARVTWIQEIVSTDRLTREIEAADLCLGIFGTTAKADRVLPYKLYFYALLGRPFVTRHSATLERLADPALLCDNTAAALADRIKTLSQDAAELSSCTHASRTLGSFLGDKEVMREKILALLQLNCV